MRTIVYIDGFNLYYRLLKDSPAYKWLNPVELVRNIINDDHLIVRLNYYTARISSRPEDINAPARQKSYLNALLTIPEVKIHLGHFLTTKPWMRLSEPPRALPAEYEWQLPSPQLVKVLKSEEKGSDVNLATHLVRDAFLDAFDVAIVVTNDSDLVEPIRVVVREVGKRVGLLVPVASPTKSLIDVASFHLHIRNAHLARSQFPDVIQRHGGAPLVRPDAWR